MIRSRAKALRELKPMYRAKCRTCQRVTVHDTRAAWCVECVARPNTRPLLPEWVSEPHHEFRFYRETAKLTVTQVSEVLGVTLGTCICYDTEDGPDAPEWAMDVMRALAGY